MILSAKIAHCWATAMSRLGHDGFFFETTEFNHLSYGYTADAPQKVIDDGECLMKQFTRIISSGLEGSGNSYADTVSVHRRPPQEIPCITRDRRLWTDEKMGMKLV